MKYYEVHSYANGDDYVNEHSDQHDIEKYWITSIPRNYRSNLVAKPLQFTNRSDAVKLKNSIQEIKFKEWLADRQYNIVPRYNPPLWKVYTFEE